MSDVAEKLLHLWQKQWKLSIQQRPFSFPITSSLLTAKANFGAPKAGFSFPQKNYKRLGPRPLAFHFYNLLSMWSSLNPFLSTLQTFPWEEDLQNEWQSLKKDLAPLSFVELSSQVHQIIEKKSTYFIKGMVAYHTHPYFRPTVEDQKVIWQEGSTKLIDLCPQASLGKPLLFIPSLINRSYILDLMPHCSLVKFLTQGGYHPYLLEWGELTSTERSFDISQYYMKRLLPAYKVLQQLSKHPLTVLGYCMGGIFGLALAQRMPIERLILMATPWDFHAYPPFNITMMQHFLSLLQPILEHFDYLPADILQSLFYAAQPELVLEKFGLFACLDMSSEKAKKFVALEDWSNDCLPMARKVAEECFQSWFGDNQLQKGLWKLAGELLLPQEINCPVLSIMGSKDRIVPPASSSALKPLLKQGAFYEVDVGHTGLVASPKAQEKSWPYLLRWLQNAA